MEAILLSEALKILNDRVNQINETEEVTLWDAFGRVLAVDIIAMRNQPPFSRSPLDGYAVRSEDIEFADKNNPICLTVVDEVIAGDKTKKRVDTGMAIRIMTGAPIPEGADCIVRQEDTDYGEEKVRIFKKVKHYENYCFEGEDYKEGSILFKVGDVLNSVNIGVLASLGLERVTVFRRPRIALITTGDEVVLPGETLAEGKIYDSNLYTLGTRLLSWNMELVFKGRIGDNIQSVKETIKSLYNDVDIIITTGGVSVGKKDIMHDVINELQCKKLFWKIALKPGMPTLCAEYKDKLLICLSGNPYGATVNLELLVRPVLAKLSGRKDFQVKKVKALCKSKFLKKSNVTRYVRAYYEDGIVEVANGSNASGILSSMIGCNCLIEIPAGTEKLNEDDVVWTILM